jgi:hypothetical protein
VLARLISSPVWAVSWNPKCSRWRWANMRSRSWVSIQRDDRKAW